MSTKERAKAAERALKNARTLCNRQRRNMKAYVGIIKTAKLALEDNDSLRALALLSGNIKYPPDLMKDIVAVDCEHVQRRELWICLNCGEEVTT
jgi:hypothetical protein